MVDGVLGQARIVAEGSAASYGSSVPPAATLAAALATPWPTAGTHAGKGETSRFTTAMNRRMLRVPGARTDARRILADPSPVIWRE